MTQYISQGDKDKRYFKLLITDEDGVLLESHVIPFASYYEGANVLSSVQKTLPDELPLFDSMEDFHDIIG